MITIRIVDFETTGMPEDPAAAICEIGWTDLQVHLGDPTPEAIQCEVQDTYSFLTNPGHPIPAICRAVHHISDADVADAVSPNDGLARLALDGPDYYAAHNSPFEQHFFADASRPWICTYRGAVRIWPDAPAFSNQVLRYHLGLDLPDPAMAHPPHRAGPDTYVTAHLLAKIIEERHATLEQLVRWSSGPPLLPKITFGKHKGSKWEDVPSDYLDWIVSKSDLDANTKANARYHLKQRAGR